MACKAPFPCCGSEFFLVHQLTEVELVISYEFRWMYIICTDSVLIISLIYQVPTDKKISSSDFHEKAPTDETTNFADRIYTRSPDLDDSKRKTLSR